MTYFKTVYRCEFTLKIVGLPSSEHYTTSTRGIEDFKDGFWVNLNMNLTRGKDARYWVPPHAIRYIAKDTVIKGG